MQLLVQWEGMTPNEATWEDYDTIVTHYPSFKLEDKVVFKERGIVMIPKVNKVFTSDNEVQAKMELVTKQGHMVVGTGSKEMGMGCKRMQKESNKK